MKQTNEIQHQASHGYRRKIDNYNNSIFYVQFIITFFFNKMYVVNHGFKMKIPISPNHLNSHILVVFDQHLKKVAEYAYMFLYTTRDLLFLLTGQY